jgi:fructokinase
MRIGVDLGGTKIEAAAIDPDGRYAARLRTKTPSTYAEALEAVDQLVRGVETQTVGVERIGVGIPGSVSARTGLIRNANVTYLNGRAFGEDLKKRIGKNVRLSNDANCLAVSEAVDGAGAGAQVVFAVIVGTGCGGGLAVDGRVVSGANGLAGEWGHNPLPWPTEAELSGPDCWCGKRGCLEMWISGTGFRHEYRSQAGRELSGEAIVEAARGGDAQASQAFDLYIDRLSRALATIVNVLDPDAFVFGGGMSNVDEIYDRLPPVMERYIFCDQWHSPLRKARWGDSSGVRGAARLWSD